MPRLGDGSGPNSRRSCCEWARRLLEIAEDCLECFELSVRQFALFTRSAQPAVRLTGRR